MIKISDLSFDYPGHRALNQISFSVARGSVTALVGSNGAGKTTLLRCIAGLEIPLLGSITVAGMNVVERPRDVHRMMGYLSDFFGLYQELTVAQCFKYAAEAQGLPHHEIAHAVQTTAQQLGLTNRLDQATSALSRGLRQRVAIGQAIIHSPQVLLLDEPASGLDPEARSSLAALFRQLQASGMTLLVSSHILAELEEYSTHMLALRDGKLLEYRAIGAVPGSTAHKHMRITLAQPNQDLAAQLSSHSAVILKTSDMRSAEFDFAGDEAGLAALLASLITAGLPITSFAEHKENLQQSYLRSIESLSGEQV